MSIGPSLAKLSARLRRRTSRRVVLHAVRVRLSRAFDVPAEGRRAVVESMLAGHARGAAAYWLQLSVAMALATFGLVLNGPAVVIGAMLVSPLMGPIVELGMGLAVGSPLLSIRSIVRAFWSMVVVVGGAALLTAALPFQEVTSEIASRASPTALDLLVAVFCALAAAFTTLRSASAQRDGVAAAAGTAIAIALVPPLCVVGFGIGVGQGAIARGAFLLFTANLCAILLVAVAIFWIFGFNLVNVQELEARRLDDPDATGRRSVRWVNTVFGSRYGTWVRFAVPLALVAIVWLPLRRALSEVSWEVRTRAAVHRIVGELPLARAAVRSAISLQNRSVNVALVVLGKPNDAHDLQATLATRIAAATATATPPNVEVVAVPDLKTMEEMARTFASRDLAARPPEPDLLASTEQLGAALQRAWPDTAAGEIRRWQLDLTERARPTLEIVHLGPALGDAAERLLAALLSEKARAPLAIRDVAIPGEPHTASIEDGAAWLPRLASAIAWLRTDRELVACVSLPPEPRQRGGRSASRAVLRDVASVRKLALAQLAEAPAEQVRWSKAAGWSVQVGQIGKGPCPKE